MKPQKFFVLICLFSLFYSCAKQEDPLKGGWEFVKTYQDEDSFSYEDYDYVGFQSLIAMSGDGHFLLTCKGRQDPVNLSESKNYNQNERSVNVYYGTWKLSKADSVIYFKLLNYEPNNSVVAKMKFNDGKNLKLVFPDSKYQPLSNKEKESAIKYKRVDYKDISDSEYTYMSSDLNKWRIKSTKKESVPELKLRLESALKFAINFFKYNKENDLSARTDYLQPLPFQFASNGIALKTKGIENWNALFYDKSDADKAYSLLEKSLRATAAIPEEFRRKPFEINLFILQETLKNLKDYN